MHHLPASPSPPPPHTLKMTIAADNSAASLLASSSSSSSTAGITSPTKKTRPLEPTTTEPETSNATQTNATKRPRRLLPRPGVTPLIIRSGDDEDDAAGDIPNDSSASVRHGFTCDLGRRAQQEDVVRALPERGVYAVVDGHAGPDLARFLASRLGHCASPSLVSAEAVAGVLGRVQDEWLARPSVVGSGDLTGCVATVLVHRRDRILVANVGDARAVLARSRRQQVQEGDDEDAGGGTQASMLQAVAVTRDHRPSNPMEAARVMQSGGVIRDGRVDGLIQVTRAFGALARTRPYLRPVPEVSAIQLAPDMAFMVIASDGVWDVLSNQEVIDIASSAQTPKEASDAVVRRARKAGARDNLSVLVVDFSFYANKSTR